MPGNNGLPFATSTIGNARWAGASLAETLRTAQIKRSIDDAMNPANLLCYEMNGSSLPAANGFPLRLVAPAWFGVANVKWLRRIEVRDTRFLGRFMGRDYVTIREGRAR